MLVAGSEFLLLRMKSTSTPINIPARIEPAVKPRTPKTFSLISDDFDAGGFSSAKVLVRSCVELFGSHVDLHIVDGGVSRHGKLVVAARDHATICGEVELQVFAHL